MYGSEIRKLTPDTKERNTYKKKEQHLTEIILFQASSNEKLGKGIHTSNINLSKKNGKEIAKIRHNLSGNEKIPCRMEVNRIYQGNMVSIQE